jgi:galacturan 1,4-alpha-galacturonidase
MLRSLILGLLQASGTFATWTAYQEYVQSHSTGSVRTHESDRPSLSYSPKRPYKKMHSSPKREKKCVVKSHNDFKTDDSSYVLQAVKKCNDGGHVLFPEGTTYVIGTALDLTGLKHIDIGEFLKSLATDAKCKSEESPTDTSPLFPDVQGYVQFTNDTDYWQAHAFNQTFQNATTFFQLGGEDVNVYGGGMLDGNGQVWYDLYAKDIYILRPILFGVTGIKQGSISNLVLRYSPQYYNWVSNSSSVTFDNINIAGGSQSKSPAKNTDGWDTYRSSNIVIQNSVINNGDDCVSFKPNSTEILVQNLHCNGSHGISVGSLGQYKGETDIVENIFVTNITMENASDGARIKVWPGAPAALSGDLQGGGGAGRVNNITYDGMVINNVDYAIEITQCYGQKNLTLCNEFPSNLTISNVRISNFSGLTSKARSPYSGYVVCSSLDVCKNIAVDGIDVLSPAGTTNQFQCGNVDTALLRGINCTSIV